MPDQFARGHLDLDDLGAEIRQQRTRSGRGHESRHLHHAYSRQGRCHSLPPAPHTSPPGPRFETRRGAPSGGGTTPAAAWATGPVCNVVGAYCSLLEPVPHRGWVRYVGPVATSKDPKRVWVGVEWD